MTDFCQSTVLLLATTHCITVNKLFLIITIEMGLLPSTTTISYSLGSLISHEYYYWSSINECSHWHNLVAVPQNNVTLNTTCNVGQVVEAQSWIPNKKYTSFFIGWLTHLLAVIKSLVETWNNNIVDHTNCHADLKSYFLRNHLLW